MKNLYAANIVFLLGVIVLLEHEVRRAAGITQRAPRSGFSLASASEKMRPSLTKTFLKKPGFGLQVMRLRLAGDASRCTGLTGGARLVSTCGGDLRGHLLAFGIRKCCDSNATVHARGYVQDGD